MAENLVLRSSKSGRTPSKFKVNHDVIRRSVERWSTGTPSALKKDEKRLHQFQARALLETRKKIVKDELDGKKPEPVVVLAPTGSGKTCIIALLPYLLESNKVLILTPAKIITDQIATAFGWEKSKKCCLEKLFELADRRVLDQFLEPVTVVEKANTVGKNLNRVVIVNAQKFSKNSLIYKSEDMVKHVGKFFEEFDTLIVDEANHYPAKTWLNITTQFLSSSLESKKMLVFLTATATRNNGKKSSFILGDEKKDRIAYTITPDMTKGKNR